MNLLQSAYLAPGFERVFLHSCSVIGSENNAIAAIQSAHGVSFAEARGMYEAEQYARQETLDGAYPTTGD